jgi:hypothetical protein
MNARQEWQYGCKLREGIRKAIKEMAHAGFQVSHIEVRKSDLKRLRKVSPTRSDVINGVLLRESTDGELKPNRFRIITNRPENADEMIRSTNIKTPDGPLTDWTGPAGV